MRRFFLDRGEITGDVATLRGEVYRHLIKVLRHNLGDQIILANGAGGDYLATIISVGDDSVTCSLQPMKEAPTAETCRISLLQGLPKGDKMELIIQKTTELGVYSVMPFVGERSIPRLSKDKEQSRINRWRKIALEAARQCQRHAIPEIDEILPLEKVLQNCNQALKLLLWEEEQAMTLKEIIQKAGPTQDIAVIVGPEGGLSQKEVAKAAEFGFVPVSLGKRILRTETAGMAIIAILQYAFGDLG